MMATGAPVDRESIAAIALKRCGAWCRRRSADARWRRRIEPDWEMVASEAAFRVVAKFRPEFGDGLPHRNFIGACCRSALADLTRPPRRRSLAVARVPLDPDTPQPTAAEPSDAAAAEVERLMQSPALAPSERRAAERFLAGGDEEPEATRKAFARARKRLGGHQAP